METKTWEQIFTKAKDDVEIGKQKTLEFSKYQLKQHGRWIYITPFPEQQLLYKIEKELSYKRNGSEFMANPEWAWVKLFQRRKSRFPIGLLHKVEQIFKEYTISYSKQINRMNIRTLNENVNGLYDFQISALRMFLLRHGGILQIPTGGGKTRIAISIIKTLHTKTLVIVPTLDLVEQWKEQVDSSVQVRTYQSLKSKKFIQQFDLVIFDECHNVAAKTLQKIGLNLQESAITLGLSATPFMRNDDNLKVESIIGPVIYKISLRELIDAGYLVDAEIHYHPLESLRSSIYDYSMMYSDYIINNKQRNGKIIHLARLSDGYTLILVNRIEHGSFLYQSLKMIGEDVIFLSGSSKNRTDTKHRIIIATSIFDEGIDIPHLKTLILAGGGKSAIKTTQRIGRVLRIFPGKEKAIVHDFIDDARWLDKHYKERREIYEKDFTIIEDIL